jgi:hypothetical protein
MQLNEEHRVRWVRMVFDRLKEKLWFLNNDVGSRHVSHSFFRTSTRPTSLCTDPGTAAGGLTRAASRTGEG